MLDDVALGPFLEQPARKGPPPFLVIAQHIELDERPGFGRFLPWRRGFTGAQADNGVADAQRLARLHRQVAGDTVALVEDAQHRHPLRHRRSGQGSALPAIGGKTGIALHLDRPLVGLRIGRRQVAVAGRKQQQGRQGRSRQQACLPQNHDASGLQAS